MTATAEAQTAALQALRAPFEPHQISVLPKPYKKDSQKGNCRECGGYHGLPAVHLDYVGHAALTDRLLNVDPLWTWEPVAFDAQGLPAFDRDGGLWIRLTVAGVTRLGYGSADGKRGGNAIKEAIGDALRNAAMRFGAALDLWHKGDLHPVEDDDHTPGPPSERQSAGGEYDLEDLTRKVQDSTSEAALKVLWDQHKPHLTTADKALLGRLVTARLEELREAQAPATEDPALDYEHDTYVDGAA